MLNMFLYSEYNEVPKSVQSICPATEPETHEHQGQSGPKNPHLDRHMLHRRTHFTSPWQLLNARRANGGQYRQQRMGLWKACSAKCSFNSSLGTRCVIISASCTTDFIGPSPIYNILRIHFTATSNWVLGADASHKCGGGSCDTFRLASCGYVTHIEQHS
jgi:hypothetical protein